MDPSRRPVPPPLPIYHPLSEEWNEIRLCSIQPGAWNDQVTCKLRIYSLDKPLAYRCLSYVWGDPNDLVPISLNGQAFSITRNLWLALRRLRWYGQLDYLWIDAVCINQADIGEKTQQVRKMTEIFSRTDEVIVWLGENDCLGMVSGYPGSPVNSLKSIFGTFRRDKTNGQPAVPGATRNADITAIGFVIALMANLATGKHITKMGYMNVCRSCSGRGEHIHTTTEWELAIRALQRFSSLPWFSRTWTIQEISLPKSAGVVLGQYNFPWNHLVIAMSNLATHWHGKRVECAGVHRGCCNLQFRRLPSEHYSILQTFINQIQDLESVRRRYASNFDIELLGLLNQFHYRQATDPRDKVFGLLGLQRVSGPSHIGVRADYSKNIREVYCSLVLDVLRAQGSLQVLQGDLTHSIPNLPSWTADWSARNLAPIGEDPGVADMWRSALAQLYKADRAGFRSRFNFDYDRELGGLQVDGLFFDKIAEVLDVISTARDLNHMGRHILKFMDFVNAKYAGQEMYVTDCSVEHMFYSLLTGDLHSDTIVLSTHVSQAQRRATSNDVQTAKSLLQPVFSNVKFNTNLHCDDAAEFTLIWTMISNRRLFITEKGYIGLGPANTSSGDCIFVLNGGSSPFMLRRAAPSTTSEMCGTKCLIVGACYLHGIMDGEASKAGGKEEKVMLV